MKINNQKVKHKIYAHKLLYNHKLYQEAPENTAAIFQINPTAYDGSSRNINTDHSKSIPPAANSGDSYYANVLVRMRLWCATGCECRGISLSERFCNLCYTCVHRTGVSRW